MRKKLIKFHPEKANSIGYIDKMNDSTGYYSIIVTRKNKLFELATFKFGYSSKRSHTIYGNLWIHNPKTDDWILHGAKIGNGDKYSITYKLITQLFDSDDKSGAHHSPTSELENIARFFRFKNFKLIWG